MVTITPLILNTGFNVPFTVRMPGDRADSTWAQVRIVLEAEQEQRKIA